MAKVRRKSGQRGVTSIAVAAGIEVGTSLLLIIHPSLFVWLLFAAELSESGQMLGRLAGFALLALALACWPGGGAAVRSALRALLVFSGLATLYLAYLGIAGALAGILLWPAVALHAALAILLGRDWFANA